MNTLILFTILAFILNRENGLVHSALSCLSESIDGVVQDLDWFTLYKLPKDSAGLSSLYLRNGTAYMFMTNENQKWTLSDLSINDTLSMAGRTIDQYYQAKKKGNRSKVGFLLYNDQVENKSSSTSRGHSKAVLLFDSQSVVWVTHSFPKYPSANQTSHNINPSQCKYGQSIICATFGIEQFKEILTQVSYVYPNVYDSFIPSFIKEETDEYKLLSKFIEGKRAHAKNDTSRISYIKTAGGERMLSISKSSYYKYDFYYYLVAPSLNSDVYVETWKNGVSGVSSSRCLPETNKKVYNIECVNAASVGDATYTFDSTKDHSKWAVAGSGQSLSACIGDINRQPSQEDRGGGAMCFASNKKVWSEYFKMVSCVEACKAKSSLDSSGDLLKSALIENKLE